MGTGDGVNRAGDNEAIVVFLAIIFGILLIALVVIIIMLRRKAVLMRQQRKHQGTAGATVGKPLEPPAYESSKEMPPLYEDQRRPEGEFLLSQQNTGLKTTNIDVISPKRKRHLYTTTTPRPGRVHKTLATELPERPRSVCSADYQTLDSICGTIRHPRTTTGHNTLHARYANTNANGEALIYPASLHTYYEIKGKDGEGRTEDSTFRPIRDGSTDDSADADMSTPGGELLTTSTSLSHTSGHTGHSKGPSMCVDRAATLSRTQYPFSPYAEASFV